MISSHTLNKRTISLFLLLRTVRMSQVWREYIFGLFFFENFPPLSFSLKSPWFFVTLAYLSPCFFWQIALFGPSKMKLTPLCSRWILTAQSLKWVWNSADGVLPFLGGAAILSHIWKLFLSEYRSRGGRLMAWRALRNLPSVVAGKKTKSEKDDKFKQIKVRSSSLIVWQRVKAIYCLVFFL